MKKIIAILAVLFLTGCSVPKTKQTIELKCENGLIIFQWWKAEVLDENTNIKYPQNLRKSGFYPDDTTGKYVRCIEEK